MSQEICYIFYIACHLFAEKVSQFCPLIEILEESPWEFNPTGLKVRNCLKIMLNLILCKSPECDLKWRETNAE